MTMRPASIVSRWFRQRRKVLLPEPDGPITATTSPLASVSDTPFSTSWLPKRLRMPSARIIGLVIGAASGLASVIDGMAFLQALEEPGQHQRHQQVETGR